MVTRSHKRIAVLCVVLVSVFAATASAGYSDLQRFIFRGFEYAGNFNYLSQPQNGPLYNYNQFRQRLEYNRGTQGYTYESFRFFGPDSYGNPNTLDLGPLKIELGRDSTLTGSTDPIGIQSRVGFSKRLIPEVFFNATTGTRGYNQFSGVTTFAPTPLQYTVTLNTGVQDMEWSGNALIDASGRLNALGFYDLDIRFTNIGNYQADGVFLHDEQVTDFDLGPIDVSGHIILDMISGFFQAVGMPSQATPTRIFSGASQKDKKLDDLLARLRAGENLTDHEWKYLTERMIEAAYRADPLGALQNGLPAEVPGFEGLSLALTATPVEGEQNGLISSAVPEPGTLGLFAVAFGSIAAMRRRCKSKR